MKISGQLRDSDSLLRNPRPNLAPSTCFHCPTYYWSHLHHHHHHFHSFTPYLRIFKWYQCMSIVQLTNIFNQRRPATIIWFWKKPRGRWLPGITVSSSEKLNSNRKGKGLRVLHSAYLPAPKYQLLFLERGCNANIPANLFLLRKDRNWQYQTQSKVLHFPPLLTLDYLVLQNS